MLPGTLNVGHALPTIAQAIIFTTAIAVAPVTLVSMVAAAVAGSYLGAGVVARLPRRGVQFGMGIALLVAAALFTVKIVGGLPPEGRRSASPVACSSSPCSPTSCSAP